MGNETPITGYSRRFIGLTEAQLDAFCEVQWRAGQWHGYLQTPSTAIWLASGTKPDANRAEPAAVQLFYRNPATRTACVTEVAWPALFQRWPLSTIGEGRLFNPQVEWRWQPDPQRARQFTLLGLSENQTALEPVYAPLADTLQAATATWQVTRNCVRLIGSIIEEQKSKATAAPQADPAAPCEDAAWQYHWWEVRNPTRLLYPLRHGGNRNLQPRLWVQVYANERTGAVAYTRYSHLETEDVKVV